MPDDQMREPLSVYIHIPLCVRKCAYCDFTSYSGLLSQRDAYVEAVCREMRAQAAFFGRRSVHTVFLGGGTPTLLTHLQVSRLLETLRECLDVLPEAEITIEGNPGTLTPQSLRALHAAGVNRLSLGVQSLDDTLLAAIGRIHTARQAQEAVAMARDAGFDNLNIDLMVGLPGQSPAQWEETLSRAIALGPEHMSCYNLIVEEGTPLYAAVRDGTCAPLPGEEELEQMDGVTQRLTLGAGYERYEVSNYALPGRECRHNLVYWECGPYLGLGCAAHSDVDGRRFYNPDPWEDYLRLANGGNTLRPAEGNGTAGERMFERMMMGLRMVRGVDVPRFERDFGRRMEDVWPQSLERLTQGGLLERKGERIALTPRGMQVMNGVLVEFLREQERA